MSTEEAAQETPIDHGVQHIVVRMDLLSLPSWNMGGVIAQVGFGSLMI